MFEKMQSILRRIEADYADIRYEIKNNERLSMANNELRSAFSNSGDGYVLRILKDGLMGKAVFTREEDADTAVSMILKNIEIMRQQDSRKISLAKAEIIKDILKAPLIEDPRNIPFSEKKQLIKDYHDLLIKQDLVAEIAIAYEDVIREKYFVSTEGTEIFEELVTCILQGTITCVKENEIQRVNFDFGGSDGYQRVRNRGKEMLERVSICQQLLEAESVKAGIYKVILNPSMTGLFTHEAFGHLSEADSLDYSQLLKDKMVLGNKIGNDCVTIIDDATIPNQLGFYRYDDEGVAVRKTVLMENGILKGRLHNRITAFENNEPISGHNIAEDYRYAPIIRMGYIFMAPGKHTFEELLKEMDNGLYLCAEMGGQTAGENFTFGANWGYVVENGKIGRMIKDINMLGNLFETLNNIIAVGNDLECAETGGCGKEQMNIRSNIGGPHILIDRVTIGGV